LPPGRYKIGDPRLAITVRRAGRKRIEEILLEKTTPKAFEAAHDNRLKSFFAAGLFRFFLQRDESGLLSIDPFDCDKM